MEISQCPAEPEETVPAPAIPSISRNDGLTEAAAAPAGPEADEAGNPYFGSDHRPLDTTERGLGDFTTTPPILRLVPLALLIGALGAGI